MQFLYLLISLIVVICDQGLKAFVVSNYSLNSIHNFIPGVLSLTYLQNDGAAWNILRGQMWFFYLISFIAIIVVLYYMFNKKYRNPIFDIGLALVLGGIVGNLIDRLHLQYVIDMLQLDFIQFNIFNIADTSITIGVILVFIYLLFVADKDKNNEK